MLCSIDDLIEGGRTMAEFCVWVNERVRVSIYLLSISTHTHHAKAGVVIVNQLFLSDCQHLRRSEI